MVELVEYILVFGVTVSLSAFSILVLGGYAPVLDESQSRAQVGEIAGAVNLAALDGNTTLVLPLSDASLTCSQSTVSLSSGGSTYTSPVAYPCSFQLTGVSCLCTLDFVSSERGVVLKVSD